MRYVSLDLETTCLKPADPTNILMLSMVVEDTENPLPLRELPHFTCYVQQERYSGEAYALGLNGWILDQISGRTLATYPVIELRYLRGFVGTFIDSTLGGLSGHVLAGKNVAGFDVPFLPPSIRAMFIHRVLDPGSVFMDWSKPKPPSLTDLKKRFGLGDTVAHDAYEDALDVIAVLRNAPGYREYSSSKDVAA